jgi:hypothetical protein
MGLQAIEAAPKDGNPVFLVDQDTGGMTTVHWAVLQGVSSQGEGASIAFSPTRWLRRSKTFERSRRTGRVVARASVAVGVWGLLLFIEAAVDNGLCGESNTRAQSSVAPTEMERNIGRPNAVRDKSLLVPRVVETTQKQILEWRREKSDIPADRLKPIQQLDEAEGQAAQAPQSAPAWERKQALEHEQECDSAEVLARALTSSLREELDALRSATEAARIKQKQALDQERDRADALARELTSLWAEPDKARIAGSEAVQAAEAERKQKQALEQERDRADTLARELTSVRSELDRARAARLEAVRTAEAAEVEQKLAFGKERDKSETLARELASARKEAEEHSARLAAVHAEVLQVTETNRAITAEQKPALAIERDRADALKRELTSVRNELEASNRKIAALNALSAPQSRESAVDSSQERMAESSSRTTEGKGRSPEQISAEATASTSGQSSASELPRPEAQSTAREAASDSGPKVAAAIERSTPASAASSRSTVDEQRLLARVNALLRQVDISGARLLLEYALERGSARAAFMLAETYDARVLRSWRALGVSGDLTKARELYARAQAGGIEDAKERIETLK